MRIEASCVVDPLASESLEAVLAVLDESVVVVELSAPVVVSVLVADSSVVELSVDVVDVSVAVVSSVADVSPEMSAALPPSPGLSMYSLLMTTPLPSVSVAELRRVMVPPASVKASSMASTSMLMYMG